MIIGVLTILGMIVTPVLYINGIKTDVALASQKNITQDSDISNLGFKADYLVKLVVMIAEKNNIDADAIKKEVENKTNYQENLISTK